MLTHFRRRATRIARQSPSENGRLTDIIRHGHARMVDGNGLNVKESWTCLTLLGPAAAERQPSGAPAAPPREAWQAAGRIVRQS